MNTYFKRTWPNFVSWNHQRCDIIFNQAMQLPPSNPLTHAKRMPANDFLSLSFHTCQRNIKDFFTCLNFTLRFWLNNLKNTSIKSRREKNLNEKSFVQNLFTFALKLLFAKFLFTIHKTWTSSTTISLQSFCAVFCRMGKGLWAWDRISVVNCC